MDPFAFVDQPGAPQQRFQLCFTPLARFLEAAAERGLIGLGHISRPGERDNPLAGGYPLKSWLFKMWDLGVFVRQDIEMFKRFDFLVDNLTELTEDKCVYDQNDVWTPSLKTVEQVTAWYEEWKETNT